jgi:hypothetical protein
MAGARQLLARTSPSMLAAGTYSKPRAIPRVSGTRISYSGRSNEMFYTYGLVKVGLKMKRKWRKHALSFLFPSILSESKMESKTPETNMKTEIIGYEYRTDT